MKRSLRTPALFQTKPFQPPRHLSYWLVGITGLGIIALSSIWYQHHNSTLSAVTIPQSNDTESPVEPFPLGVNPQQKTISEHPFVDTYIASTIASNHTRPVRNGSFLAAARESIRRFGWYQQLAAPLSRTVVIWSGERYEQVARSFQQAFAWTDEETAQFINLVPTTTLESPEGAFYPGRYTLEKQTSPEVAAAAVSNRFSTEVLARYTPDIEKVVPLKDILIIASLIEREAAEFEDMRYISGVIWNRLFIDMPLQLDATLQYAKGSPGNNRDWWPVPTSADKFIDSPFNTYQISGLPPSPISNPSVDAIIAALNPRDTDCLFYLHADDGTFYCSRTYDEHLTTIQTVLQ